MSDPTAPKGATPFEKVETQVDFPAQERAILEFWQRMRAFDKLREKNAGKKPWSFLDGPITANNPMGVHHAWGRTYKDAYQRYFAMTGRELRYQNGFDCQGLWVEVEVEKELGLKSKRDIETLIPGDRFASIDKFVTLCKDRVNKFARVQTEQSIRLGYWMDWDLTDADWAKSPDDRKSYFTMSEENNYTIWSFLKRCHDRKLVYRGFDAMPWCSRCGVGISQMEMHEGYRLVAHKSVFIKFPLRGRPGEYLLAWTTTPWTLTSNVGAAVNPELTYLKIKHRDEFYYVAKGAYSFKRKEEEFKRKEWLEGVPKLKPIEQIFKEKGGGEIVGELKGADMVGWAYDGPFDELPAQAHAYGYPEELADVVQKQNWAPTASAKVAHRVIAWKDVGETEGTGIVHIAPGCGREDFGLGKEVGLPPIAPLDETGTFLPGFGELSGKSAVDPATAEWILFNLQQKNRLFASEQYPHTYPHCWRCKTELLFRLVDEWYIGMSWRAEIMQIVESVTFLPESINGKARELDWLKNMGDWMISKKRFWGLALPIWVDEVTGEFEVIGSRAELKSRAVEGWAEFESHPPHRPWIDQVKIRNPKTGNRMSRIGDVGNPWLDAGIVPYSTLGYNKDRAYWEKWFPADFITEAFPGQFRNWFYAILTMSTMMENRAPFKVLLGHAMVRDEKGDEMHKSKGNSIAFDEAADTMGADVCRWLYCRTNPAANINFGYGPADEIRSKFILKLWNSYAFFCNYARLDGFDPAQPQTAVAERPDIDRWILSDLQLLIQKAHSAFTTFDVASFCLEAERFVDDKLSNWYIRRNRRRFWKGEKGKDKDAAYQTLYTVLMTLAKLIASVVPFLAETMYQNLKTANEPESVHLCDFPQADEKLVDEELSIDMANVLELVTLGSAARNESKIKVRQPLGEMKVAVDGGLLDIVQRAIKRFSRLLEEELNVKQITLCPPETSLLTYNFDIKKNARAKYGAQLKEIREALAKETVWTLYAQSVGSPDEPTLIVNISTGPISVEKADIDKLWTAPDGWAAAVRTELRSTVEVLIDKRITPELAQEGTAREIVRFVQDLRKKSGLEMEDRIALSLSTESEVLRKAIEAHRDYIAAETLVREWSGGTASADVKIDGQSLRIELQKV